MACFSGRLLVSLVGGLQGTIWHSSSFQVVGHNHSRSAFVTVYLLYIDDSKAHLKTTPPALNNRLNDNVKKGLKARIYGLKTTTGDGIYC